MQVMDTKNESNFQGLQEIASNMLLRNKSAMRLHINMYLGELTPQSLSKEILFPTYFPQT